MHDLADFFRHSVKENTKLQSRNRELMETLESVLTFLMHEERMAANAIRHQYILKVRTVLQPSQLQEPTLAQGVATP